MAKSSGRVTGINDNMVTVEFEGNVSKRSWLYPPFR